MRCRRAFTHLILVALAVPAITEAQNPIQTENSQPGTPGWQLSNPATNREIEGYASLTSVNIGGSISFFVSTGDSSFNLEIFRTGWYAGLGARRLLTVNGLPGVLQVTPAPDPVTGLIECQWISSYTLNVPTTWVSGVYLARLTGNQSGKQSYIVFVVRDDARTSDLIFESSVTTYEAYNFWPNGANGKSLYGWAPGGRAWKVSFNRPYVLGDSYSSTTTGAGSGVGAGSYLTNLQPGPAQGYPITPAGWEYNMVRWLEKNGYDVTYMTDVDLDENPNILAKHHAFLSVGHNEYWSMPMRQNLQAAIAHGVNAGFFSSNAMYWQIRFENASDGTPDRTMVCYKTDAPAYDPDYTSNPQLATVEWRNNPVNLPEAAVEGVEYVGDPETGDIVISNASHWLMNGTGLTNGQHLTGLLGYEVDVGVPGTSPPNMDILASSPAGPFNDVDNPPGFSCGTSACNSNMTWYSAGKAFVFATGSMQWSWGLDDYNAPSLRAAYSSAAVQQLTANVLAAFITPVAITTASLPSGTVGVPYPPVQLTATGGGLPYSWTASGIPGGLTLSSAGVLSGTPTAAGTNAATVTATDPAQHSASKALSLLINPGVSVPARTVSIDFVGQGTAMGSSESAGVVPRTNWNNATGSVNATGFSLLDETGVGSGASVTWTSDNVWSVPITDASGNVRMMRGYLDTGNQNTTTIKVSGLPPSSTGYDLYVYIDGDNESSTNTGTYTLSGSGIATTSIKATDPGNTNFNGTFQQANNSAGNYVKFTAIQATAFTLAAIPTTAGDGALRAPVNGIQIVPTPTTTYAISGQITVSGSGLANVTVWLSNGFWTTTNSTGAYSFSGLVTGTYTVSAALGGYTFTPPTQTFSNIVANQTANFTAASLPVYVVSIDFVGQGTAMAASESAGVVPRTNWNDAAGNVDTTALSLVDERGMANGASVTWTSDNVWTLPIADAPGNVRMMRGYLDTGNQNTTTIQVSGLPPSSTGYDLYIYTDGDNETSMNTGTYRLSGSGIATTSIKATDPGNTNFSGTFQQANNSAGNYVKFTAIQATAFTLAAIPTTAGDGALRAPVNGIQIVPTPSATYTISGHITASGAGLAGVTVSLSNGFSTTTGSTGAYSFGGLISGSYTISAALDGYTFNPPSQTFTNLAANQTANFTAANLPARSVSIDFVGQGTAMGSSESAGVVPRANWNNATGNLNTSGFSPVDETGIANGTNVTWTSDNVWSLPIADGPGNVRMMRGYLDTGNENTTTVKVSGLPPSSTGYDVYVYIDGDNETSTNTGTYTLSGSGIATTSIKATDPGNTNFNGTFQQANNSAGNYVKFTAIQATAFTLAAIPTTAGDGALRAPVNGIQIVPTPTATYAISGQITASGAGLAGVTVSLSNGFTTTTSSTGAYSFSGLVSGTYTVTASVPGYTFTPPNRTFSNLAANQTANFSATSVPARTVSMNFVGQGTAMGLSESAGVVPKTNWNNATGGVNTAAFSLLDETGVANGASATWMSDNVWSVPIADAPGNVRMMRGYLDTGNQNTTTVKISGLPPSSTGYDIYIYTDGDNATSTVTGTYTLSGSGIVTTSIKATDPGNTNFGGTFQQANNSAGNYVEFTAIQATAFTLAAIPTTGTDGVLRAPVNGIQIVPH